MSHPLGSSEPHKRAEITQCANRVLMVRPSRFGFNTETAGSNRFQAPPTSLLPDDVQRLALCEFEALQRVLDRAGVAVNVFEDDPHPHTPDAVFPNNWVSFHPDGALVYYPMLAENRRFELRRDWIQHLQASLGNPWHREIDLTHLSAQGAFLEGTGSLVLDHRMGIAYAGLSDRTTPLALNTFAEATGYRVLSFATQDLQGQAIYHTNVMMGLGETHAVVCLECIALPEQRVAVVAALEASGKTIVELSQAQILDFAGNQLALQSQAGDPLIALSERAWKALSREQVQQLERHASLLTTPLSTIEHHGGGSARCMLAEVHMPC